MGPQVRRRDDSVDLSQRVRWGRDGYQIMHRTLGKVEVVGHGSSVYKDGELGLSLIHQLHRFSLVFNDDARPNR